MPRAVVIEENKAPLGRHEKVVAERQKVQAEKDAAIKQEQTQRLEDIHSDLGADPLLGVLPVAPKMTHVYIKRRAPKGRTKTDRKFDPETTERQATRKRETKSNARRHSR